MISINLFLCRILILNALFCLAAFAQTTNGTNTSQATNIDDEVSTENSTTTAGTTSSESTPTTSPPLPAKPEAGKWFINSTGNNICLIVSLGARFTFNYNITGGKVSVGVDRNDDNFCGVQKNTFNTSFKPFEIHTSKKVINRTLKERN